MATVAMSSVVAAQVGSIAKPTPAPSSTSDPLAVHDSAIAPPVSTTLPSVPPLRTPTPSKAPSPPPVPMLREWSYREPLSLEAAGRCDLQPQPQPQGAARSSSLPTRPCPAQRSRTPVAFAVKESIPAAVGGTRHQWLNASAAAAAASATLGQQQQQPVVATLVTNLACNLRIGLENLVYAGVAERIEEGGGGCAGGGGDGSGNGEGRQYVVDPTTQELRTLPPPPSALPDEHGLASLSSSSSSSSSSLPTIETTPDPTQAERAPSNRFPDPRPEASRRRGGLAGTERQDASLTESGLEPPSSARRERFATSGSDDSLRDWVLDDFDEAEFHVQDGRLVEVRVPVPSSAEFDEMYEEAMEKHVNGGRGRRMGPMGIGCVRRPRAFLPDRRRPRSLNAFEAMLGDEAFDNGAGAQSPLGRFASEPEIALDDPEDDEADAAEPLAGSKGGNGKARHPVLRWVQRRRKARQQRRERKIAEATQPQHQQNPRQSPPLSPQNSNRTLQTEATSEDGGAIYRDASHPYRFSVSERPARAEAQAGRTTKKHSRRSRSLPGRRGPREARSQSACPDALWRRSGEADGPGVALRRSGRSKSPKRGLKASSNKRSNIRKATSRRRGRRNRTISLDDLVVSQGKGAADKEADCDFTPDDELEEDPFGRLKPLPNDPWPKLRAGAASTRSHSAAPVANVTRLTSPFSTRRSLSPSPSSKVRPEAPAPHSLPCPSSNPVLAFAATATARVVESFLLQQQQHKQPLSSALPLAKLLPGAIPALSSPPLSQSPSLDAAKAAELRVPPPAAFFRLPFFLPAATLALDETEGESEKPQVRDCKEGAWTEPEDDCPGVTQKRPDIETEVVAAAELETATDTDTVTETSVRRFEVEKEPDSRAESILEGINQTSDDAPDEYPIGDRKQHDEDDDQTVPSLAETDVSSRGSSPPREVATCNVLRRYESFDSLGNACDPRDPNCQYERSLGVRSLSAPSRMLLPSPFSKIRPDEDAAAATAVVARNKAFSLPVLVGDDHVFPPSPPLTRPPLKVVFVGNSIGAVPGAVDVARRLAAYQRRRRRANGAEKIPPSFEVWNGPGRGKSTIGSSHHASQSLFFTPGALYVLFWDMALDDFKTYPRGRRLAYSDDDDTDDTDDDDDDHFAVEESNRRADRALERCADEDVSFWVDYLLRSFEERRLQASPGVATRCTILPVAIAPSRADRDEVKRRCNLLRSRLLRLCEERERRRRRPDDAVVALPNTSLMPEFIFPGRDGTVLCVGTEDGDLLGKAVEAVAVGRSREIRRVVSPLSSASAKSTAMVVRDLVCRLKRSYKVVSVYRIAVLLQEIVKLDEHSAENAVKQCLLSMAEDGEVIYFGGASTVNSKSPPACAMSWAASSTNEVTRNEDNEEDLISRFVVLNPRWLSSAVSCILRPDLRREIMETRSLASSQFSYDSSSQPHTEALNMEMSSLSSCPVITSEDVKLLWRSMAFMREASDDVDMDIFGDCSISSFVLFEFLEAVCVQSSVFLPVFRSLCVPQTYGCLGTDLDTLPPKNHKYRERTVTMYLLPGLMAPNPPFDTWTYKAKESWNTTLCHSWVLRDNVSPGLMERVTGAVIQVLLDHSVDQPTRCGENENEEFGPVRLHQVTVWGSAFILRLGMDVICPLTGERTESIIELFAHFNGASGGSGPPCVGSNSLGSAMKRLTVSAKGQAGGAGRKIWNGGFGLVINAIERALRENHGNLSSNDRDIFCPECLFSRHPCEASSLKADRVKSYWQDGLEYVRCEHGHPVEIGLVTGIRTAPRILPSVHESKSLQSSEVPVGSLLGGVVVVGLWDGEEKQIKNIGSGFIADKERGLIITASHILFEMQSAKSFGKEFFGLKDAKALIGVIPKSGSSNGSKDATAVFRYFAEVVAHDVRNVDACVLRITTKLEDDIGGEGEGCGDQPEIPLKNNIKAMKAERLQQLKITKKVELEECVRVLGYNQGGEGRLTPGMHINRCADLAKGYVCKKFKISAAERESALSSGFNPLEETVVMCPTISGHSGGPCVNNAGAVIGILSRADPAERDRCYLVPSTELKRLLKKAKSKCSMSPLDLYYKK